MAGYIGSKASVVSSGAERKKVFDITTTTTSLTGCSYTPNQVHVFHNGVRLVDGTDYTATDGSTVTLTTAAQSGDEVVVVSYATFQPADAYTKTESDDRFVNDPNAVITVSGSNVGIGTSSPDALLDVSRSGNGQIAVLQTSANRGFSFESQSDTALQIASIQGSTNLDLWANTLTFSAGAAERARIDASGNLLVGMTSASTNNDGAGIRADGLIHAKRADVVATFNRKTSDGAVVEIAKDNTVVGSIGAASGYPYFQSASNVGLTMFSYVQPRNNGAAADNIVDLGSGSFRFDDIFATNGTIQTSDINEKQDIEDLSDAEQRVAVAAKGLLRKYRWKDAVAEKGDAARIHFGIIAQDLQAAFEAEGLDAARYGMFISSTWWEAEVEKTREVEQEDGTTITETYTATETYDEPTEGATERTRLGVRYPELLAFIIAAL